MKKKLALILLTSIFVISACGTSFAAEVLSIGDYGDDVYILQQTLADYGYYYDELTGYYGYMTQSAVQDFQYDYGLYPDGVAGEETLSYLGLYYESDYDDFSWDYYDYLLDYTFYPGMESSAVYDLQTLLVAYGYLWEATGFYGDVTVEAVSMFQSDYGLTADGIAGPSTISALLGYEYSGAEAYYNAYAEYADAIVAAASWTPAAASGYCASWVTQVLRNAGVLTYDLSSLRSSPYSYAATSGLADGWYAGNTGFNANDYWAYVCYSSDPADLAPGMIVASRSSYTYLGGQFGHVGIYIGDGLVTSSVGYLETISIDEWIRRYNNAEAGSTVRWGYLPL